ITVYSQTADGNFSIHIRRIEWAADVAIKSELTSQLDSITAHLLFDFRQQTGRNQHGLQFSRVRRSQVNLQIRIAFKRELAGRIQFRRRRLQIYLLNIERAAISPHRYFASDG